MKIIIPFLHKKPAHVHSFFVVVTIDTHFNSQESPESLLRSALQGKGYAKTVHLQTNGITLIPSQNTVKQEEELRRVLFANDHQVRDYNFSSSFYFISPTYSFCNLSSISIIIISISLCLFHSLVLSFPSSLCHWIKSNWNLNAFSMYYITRAMCVYL